MLSVVDQDGPVTRTSTPKPPLRTRHSCFNQRQWNLRRCWSFELFYLTDLDPETGWKTLEVGRSLQKEMTVQGVISDVICDPAGPLHQYPVGHGEVIDCHVLSHSVFVLVDVCL
ncbi:hypothetical protein DPEC_G00263970 [Dallia pectoralis]|uniref:Uncharacterized protein n=1 Tax=Dallia pectoralis TaxID=75939 RepID=A0ACC2FS19_DALPE|nr:hypothetical protein DPEC_G00263970 [Dallia pectoralis]